MRPAAVLGSMTSVLVGVAALVLLFASDRVAPDRTDEMLLPAVESALREGPQPPPAGLEITPLDDARHFRAPATAALPAIAPVTIAPADGARLILSRLAIDLPLREGDAVRDVAGQATPPGAAFHLPSSVLPGEVGNSYVYAHARRGQFLGLWDVHLGDRVEIVAPSGHRLAYVVVEIHPRVSATDVTYLEPTDDERLTLQTSTGPRPTDPRFVVVTTPLRP